MIGTILDTLATLLGEQRREHAMDMALSADCAARRALLAKDRSNTARKGWNTRREGE